MIAITSDTYDLLGYIELDGPGLLDRTEERRVSVTRTLDGGVKVDDAGYSPGDRERQFVVLDATEDQVTRAERLVSLHSDHHLFDGEHAYSGSLRAYSYTPPELRLSFQIESEDV